MSKHLVIKQNQNTELVNTNIISKLYHMAYEDAENNIEAEIDSGVNDITGVLHSPTAYQSHIDYLMNKFPNLTITASATYVSFKDPAIEAACIAQFSSDGIGITSVDALAVTNIPSEMFKNNTDIEDFSDLSTVFPNCQVINLEAFMGSTIKYFDFSNIISIGNEAFKNSLLEGELTIPRLTGTLGQGCFQNTKISKIASLGNLITIEGRSGYGLTVFGGCTLLTEVILPTTLTKIYDAFNGCTAMTKITGLENITYFDVYWNGTGLSSSVLHFDNIVDKFYYSNFDNFTLGQLYIPKVTVGYMSKSNAYYDNWFYSAGLLRKLTAGLVYLRDITTLYPGDISNCTINALVIDNINVPSLNNRNDALDADVSDNKYKWNNVFANFTGVIYVPDSALNAYLTDAKWSTLNLDIRGMSNLTTYATEEAWIEADRPVALIEEYMNP